MDERTDGRTKQGQSALLDSQSLIITTHTIPTSRRPLTRPTSAAEAATPTAAGTTTSPASTCKEEIPFCVFNNIQG